MVATTSKGKPREGRFTGTCRAAASAAHSRRLGRRRIQRPEVLEHQPTLLGGETLELLPPGVPEPRARARRARLQDVGDVHAVSGRGPADALLVLVGLVVRERAAGVGPAAVQRLRASARAVAFSASTASAASVAASAALGSASSSWARAAAICRFA